MPPAVLPLPPPTTEQVGAIPTGTRVRISHAWYENSGWIYAIMSEDETTFAEAHEWQINQQAALEAAQRAVTLLQRGSARWYAAIAADREKF